MKFVRWCFEKININLMWVVGNFKGIGFLKVKSFKENMN